MAITYTGVERMAGRILKDFRPEEFKLLVELVCHHADDWRLVEWQKALARQAVLLRVSPAAPEMVMAKGSGAAGSGGSGSFQRESKVGPAVPEMRDEVEGLFDRTEEVSR